jgi:hypothetical protein
MVHDHQVIAYAVEIILIAPREPGGDVCDGVTVLVEDLVSKLLQALYVALVAGKANLKLADSAES